MANEFAVGFGAGAGIRQNRREREAEDERLRQEATKKRAKDAADAVNSARERTVESVDSMIGAASEMAANGVDREDPRFQKVIEGIRAQAMVFGSTLNEMHAAAREAGLPEEVLLGLEDPTAFVEDQVLRANSAVDAAFTNRVETITGADLPEGMPEGMVAEKHPDGSVKVLFTPPEETGSDADRETNLEQRVRFLIESGLDDETAKGIAAGRLSMSKHPLTDELQVVDLGTGEVVFGGPLPTPEPGELPSIIPEDVQTGEAVGAFGLGARALNVLTDSIGAGLANPQAQEATSALNTISTLTVLLLQAEVEGKPAVDVRDRIDKLAVKPNSIFQGEETAKDRLAQTKQFIDSNIAQKQLILDGAMDPQKRSELQANVTGLKQISAAHQTLIDGFDGTPDVINNAMDASQAALDAGDVERARAINDALEADDQDKLKELLGGSD